MKEMNWIDGAPPISFRGPCMFLMNYDHDKLERRLLDVGAYDPVRGIFVNVDSCDFISLVYIVKHCPLEWPK